MLYLLGFAIDFFEKSGRFDPHRSSSEVRFALHRRIRVHLSLRWRCRRQLRTPGADAHGDVGKGEEHGERAGVFGKTSVATPAVAELSFDDLKRMLAFRTHAGFAGPDRVLRGKPACAFYARGLARHFPLYLRQTFIFDDLRSFFDACVSGIGVGEDTHIHKHLGVIGNIPYNRCYMVFCRRTYYIKKNTLQYDLD